MAKQTSKTIGPAGKNTAPAFRRGNDYVLAIGIDDYPERPLHNCVHDVEAFRDVLVERYGFQAEHIQLLLNREASRPAIITRLRHYASTLTADDNFILYYSGHGILDKTYNEGYWLVHGCDIQNYASNGMANQDVLLNIRALKARHVALLIDSCFSGSFFSSTRDFTESSTDVDELERHPSRWAITSGRNEPVSDGQQGAHSPFAKYLLEYLRRDDHLNGRFTIAELDLHIKRSVGPNSRQKPDGSPLLQAGHQGGAFVFRLKTRTKEQAAYTQAVEKRDIRLLEDFIDDYENSPLKPAAKQLLRELEAGRDWALALRKNSIAGYDDFIDAHPGSPHADDARALKKELRAARDREAEKTVHLQAEEENRRQQPRNGFVYRDLPDTPEMVFVEGGTFQMGSNEYADEKPVHSVTLSPFWIGKYPLTFEEYDRFCEATKREKPKDQGWGRGKRPVINVSWQDAGDYCAWLSQKTGRQYRLPTEAEWEFAARGGTLSKGFQFAGSNALGEAGWFSENAGGKTQPVGGKKPNELGLHDMSGNVWEWCNDWYGAYASGAQTNPAGPKSGSYRVYRGGSWLNGPRFCRSAYRIYWHPARRCNDLGFRLALSLSLQSVGQPSGARL